MKPRVLILAFLLTLALIHGLVAWWTPIQADDWKQLIWSAQHDDRSTSAWLVAFGTTHFTFSDVTAYVLANAPLVHVLVTPLVMVALVVGLFTFATRRLPGPSWDDLLALSLASAAIWMTQPHAGTTLFHISNVAVYLYGTTLALWFVMPLCCGWQPPRWTWPLLAVAGYCTGSSTRAIATATLIGFIVALRTLPRARWMWIAFAGLLVGTIAGYVDPPWIEFGRIIRRGLEPNLVVFRTPLEEGGELIMLVASFVIINAVLAAYGKAHAPAADAPDPRATKRWLLAWFAVAVWCLFGPRFADSTLLPATALLIVAALPYLQWLARSPLLRYVLVVLAVGTHIVVWAFSLRIYRDLDQQARARVQALRATPIGTVAKVAPYSQVMPTFWVVGEDMLAAAPRQSVAINVYGLRDIELVPAYRRYEVNPAVSVELVADDVDPKLLAAAKPPAFWGGEISVARTEFSRFVRRLRKQGVSETSARLAVTGIAFPERGTRPLLAAWIERGELVTPRISRGAVQQNSRYAIRIYPPYAARFREAYLITQGETHKLKFEAGTLQVRPKVNALHVVVLCDPSHCLVADAFIPLI